MQLAALVVQSRTGRDMDALTAAGAALERQGGRIVFAAAVPVPCASSDIRAGTLPPDRLRAALPAPVRRLICENDLYGLGVYLKNP